MKANIRIVTILEVLNNAIRVAKTPTAAIVTRVTIMISLSDALGLITILSFAKIDPAPRRSESALDIVADTIPANNNPQIIAGIASIARTGSA